MQLSSLSTPLQFLGNYKVLIAEDTARWQKAIEEEFKQKAQDSGDTLDITTVASLDEAKKALGFQTFDIVSTDNSMPNDNEGLTLLDFLKTLTKRPYTLMVSGAKPSVKKAALEKGAIFIDKDEAFEEEGLPNAIKKALDILKQC